MIKEEDIRNSILVKYDDIKMSHYLKREANYDLKHVYRSIWIDNQITEEEYYTWARNTLFDVPNPGMTNRIKWYIKTYKEKKRQELIMENDELEAFLTTGKIIVRDDTVVVLYKTDIPGKELELLEHKRWAINIHDKKLWIGDIDNKPVEYQLTKV